MSERIARGLGATRPVGSSSLVFFVPSTDRLGAAIDHDFWVDAALREFGRIFRGATAYPRGRGIWRDDERGGAFVFDEPTIVISYFDPDVLTDEAL